MKYVLWGFLLELFSLGSDASGADLIARIQPVGGVPQLMINGVPTEARMFYGGLGRKLVRLTPGTQAFSFPIHLLEDEENARLVFGFDPDPGEVTVDQIVIRDLTVNQVVLSGTSEMIQKNGADAKPVLDDDWPVTADRQKSIQISFKRGHHYQLDFRARADARRRLSLAVYRSSGLLGAPGEPFFEQITFAARSGVNLIEFPITMPWPKEGESSDTSVIDLWCRYILEANPKALLVPRIDINPPRWWLDAHPADEMQWQGPDKPGQRQVTICSQLYQEQAKSHLLDLVSHLEEQFGSQVAGYHIAGQNSNEWFYPGTWSASFHGYAPADLQAWRSWLRMRYGTDTALQAKWNKPNLLLDAVSVPALSDRFIAGDAPFYDPIKNAMLLDWNEFQQTAMADAVCGFAHAVRDATKGRKLVLFFYGYTFEFAGIQKGPASSGHYALRKILDSPDIDILCGPISYHQRGLGGIAAAMSPAESVALAGKMWLMEDDTATYLSSHKAPGWKERADNLQESNELLLRNGAEIALRNMGTWWMDLGQDGWFDDPGLWTALGRFRPVENEIMKAALPYRPDIAAVIDEKSLLLLPPHLEPEENPMQESRIALGDAGAPYGQYLLDDVMAGRVQEAKAYFFLDAWSLTPQERTQLLEQMRGKVRVWCYASGYFDGNRPSLAAMESLTQFRVREIPRQAAWATPTSAGQSLGLKTPWGVEKQLAMPLFSPVDATGAEVLATFPDGSPAVAIRRSTEGTSIFVGVPGINSDLVRLAAREAEVPLISETDAVVFANGPFVALHAIHDGPLRLHTATTAKVRDALTGEEVGQGPVFDLPIKQGETRVLRVTNKP